MIGQVIKDYTFKHTLGQGGMATVWLAEHNTLRKPVAIKILNKEFVHNENIRKRFLSEARNLFGMSHPNIIKVTDLIDQDDMVAFVMEYMEGQTLKDYLDANGKLPDEKIKQLFTQMLDAVGYVHEQGLIHRDIKPSNFMISNKGVIKLLDFGIAKNTDINSAEYTITGTTQNMGTPMYMSPEQVKSTKDVTAQSDIYSLGVVLWQMVMGRKPYDINSLSTWDLQTKIVNNPLPLTFTKWDSIITRATEKDFSLRLLTRSDFNFEIVNKDIEIVNSERKNIEEGTIVEEHVNRSQVNNQNSTILNLPPIENTITTTDISGDQKSNKILVFSVIGVIFVLVSIFFVYRNYFNPGNLEKADGYYIHGSISGSYNGWVLLEKREEGKSIIVDSVQIKDGKFEFTGKVDSPMMYYVKLQNVDGAFPFFIENAALTIEVNVDILDKSVVKGSASHDKYTAYLKDEMVYNMKMEDLYGQYMQAKEINDAVGVKNIEMQYDSVQNALSAFTKNYILNNGKSIVASYLAISNAFAYSLDDLKAINNAMDPSISASPYVKALAEREIILTAVEPGQQAPDFSMYDAFGTDIHLSSLRGKVVLVDFWASWCGPCRAENPNVVAAYKKFNNKGFTVFGVSLDTDKEKWQEAIAKDGLSWTQVGDMKGWENTAAKQYGVMSIPANFLLDKDGKIVASGLRGEDLVNKLQELLP